MGNNFSVLLEKPAISEFDLLEPPKKPRVRTRIGSVADLDIFYSLIRRHVPGPVAPEQAMQRVMNANPWNVLAFTRIEHVVGLYAMLMLNRDGLERLLSGAWNGLDPDGKCLAAADERPAAIYQWMVVAPGMAAEGVMHVSHFLRRPLYRHANLYARLVTEGGRRIATSVGFKPLGNLLVPDLHCYIRLANRAPGMADAA